MASIIWKEIGTVGKTRPEPPYIQRESFRSPHNLAVTAFIQVKQSLDVYETVLKSSCLTYYEMLRRDYKSKLPENLGERVLQSRKKKDRQRRQRLLETRATVLREEEKELWEGVTQELMSDEEDEPDGGERKTWLVKRPTFRSAELSTLCHQLQLCLESDSMYISTHTARVLNEELSERSPPLKMRNQRHYASLVNASPSSHPTSSSASQSMGSWLEMINQ
ncbi:hypothetical protein SKAU_G00412400 [Synaphobranchus kaupii]|uniref:Uncharacterized protein n=1 Tax=Synaphobranchus kaupii TaxID=118154 RepID=A0A9Q1E843_SYNKA|nr:hypothetical protein SKAU_G00412400 [Synaphobranchus kaupii]